MTFRTPGFGRRLGTGRTRLVVPVLVALAILLVAFMVFTSIWTNLLWYRSVGFSSVYTTQLWARVLLFLGAGLLMAVVVGANMVIAYKLRPAYRPLSVEQQGLERYRAVVDPHRKLIAGGLLGLLGLLTGSSVAGQWPVFLAFLNRTSFGLEDPQFHKDISFYVFTYPFLRLVLGVVFATVILSILASVAVHYLYGGLRLQGPGDKASGPARAHLSVLVGLFVLLKAFAYWFDRYGLAHSERGVVTGASYTDVNALLPAKTILALIALICAALFFVNITRRGMMLPGVGFTLLVVSAILVGGVYPLLIQQFQVKPDELAKERQFIARNIEATRAAYGVDGVKPEVYGATPATDAKKLTAESGRLQSDGVRLLDPNVVGETFQRLQQGRNFYKFPDPLDVDRYKVDNKTIDTIVALREVSGAPAGQQSWVKDRLVYTHGYGFVSAYGDRIAAGGNPDFVTKDMPVSPAAKIKVDKPQIYFGERSPGYSVVGGQGQQELDFPDDKSPGGQAYTQYEGSRGVPIDSFFNKLLFATKFQEKNLLLSGAIKSGAKILYNRNPREMVQRTAPWLTLDGDPYPAVVNGRILWILDGYTTSNGYPYSEQTSLGDATRDTVTDTRSAVARQANDRINYMRNSVKATVDAYDGTIHLYQWDDKDPVVQTWMKVFKGTVEPKSAIDKVPGLKDHFRYPQDMFKVQRRILAKYHVTEPGPFFNGEGFWSVPEDPGAKGKTQPPYYQALRMPGDSAPQFSLTSVFTPRGRGNLAAFMAVDTSADPARIRVLELPRNSLVDGPELVQGSFGSDPGVQAQLLPLKQSGTTLVYGNLLTLPFADGILYIEPVYAKVSGGTGQQPYPILRKVLVRYGEKSAAGDNLADALKGVFGGTGTVAPPTSPGQQGQPQTGGQLSASAQKAITDLQNAINAFEDAQRKGDFNAMGEAWKQIKAARDALAAAQAAAAAKPAASPSPSPTGSPSPTPTGSPTPTS
ncbi:UPF0182 family membrane protein [Actinomadura rudentiformis]|uniref:UPF0182 protein F8566_35295 n=1 Tax=Actinomadura rudentiformis TaxID=359158 RepID=A0A6H9YSV5_9ACTN|nr:UPF0182 family protein [Actinomadura rudentiformis]KAB2343398.1 UPF0182 family protein [Actinomadura rudentiformis]